MQQITPSQLKQILDSMEPAPLLLDVREPEEYAFCHIEGSLLIPMGQIPSRLGELEQDQKIVAICHHGVRSSQVASYLEHQGFENVMNLLGGVDAWAMDVETTMVRY